VSRFLFDTSVLIDYIHEQGVGPDVLALAAEHGQGYVSEISIMELWLPRHSTAKRRRGMPVRHPSDEEIRQEIERVLEACGRFGFTLLRCCSATVQYALTVLQYCHSPLGKNAIADSLLIASGIRVGAILITHDRTWAGAIQELQRRKILDPEMLVLDPVQFVQTYAGLKS